MSVYLHDIPLSQAQARLQQALEEAGLWRVLGSEAILLDENALGRVTAEPIWAKVSSPHYHASAMDGFAVRAEDTSGAQPSAPVQLSVINRWMAKEILQPMSAVHRQFESARLFRHGVMSDRWGRTLLQRSWFYPPVIFSNL
jgi:molybdopterin biosynthesis enzyme